MKLISSFIFKCEKQKWILDESEERWATHRQRGEWGIDVRDVSMINRWKEDFVSMINRNCVVVVSLYETPVMCWFGVC